MGSVIKGLLSIVGIGGEKAPRVSGAAGRAVDVDLKKSRRRRISQFRTEGGVVGEEIAPEQISRRDTILGN